MAGWKKAATANPAARRTWAAAKAVSPRRAVRADGVPASPTASATAPTTARTAPAMLAKRWLSRKGVVVTKSA